MFYLFIFSVSILVVDKTGRRVLLLMSGIVMAIPLATIGGFFYLFNEEGSKYSEWRGSFEWLPLVCIIIYMIGYSIGYACVPFLLLGELLPENMRNLLGINGEPTLLVHCSNKMLPLNHKRTTSSLANLYFV